MTQRDISPSPAGDLLIVPLGGLGEIGMNCMAIEQSDGILVVDCGITFPDDDVGIDTYHPDLSYLVAHRDRVAGVFLTHGHEDHVGALPYLLSALRVPVFGPPHALAVARHRLSERGIDPERHELIVVTPRQRYAVGPFEVEPVRVAHSITDATALAIRTSAGLVVHTGDFRFDPTPPDGEPTDEARLAELGAEGVRLLLSDSTNIDARSPHPSEAEVGRTLEPLVRAAEGRVVIAMFASNVQRLRMIGELCLRTRRKIALFGRSLELQVQWAAELGKLGWPSDRMVARDQAASVAPEELLVLAGGTQAEPGSSLARLAARAHPSLTLTPEDTVIFSSRIIPGNDRKVFAMIGDFLRQGVTVKSWITDPMVHTSGHAHRDEQQRMLELVNPRGFIPVHGTRHHLERHAALARATGVEEALVIENGEVARVAGDGLRAVGRVRAGRVATWQGHPLSEAVLRERHSLARAGALSVALVVDRAGHLAAPPSVRARGVVEGEESAEGLRFISLEISKALGHAGGREDAALIDAARRAARRAVEARTGRKPMCTVHLVRI